MAESTNAGDPRSLFASHFRDDRFFNPWEPFRNRFRDFLKWRLSSSPWDKKRPPEIPRIPNDGSTLSLATDTPTLTWIGHSSFAVQDSGEVILTDPHFGSRALLPGRKSPPGIPLSSVPRSTVAVLSHNHYDHLDAWTVRRLPPNVEWFVPLGNAAWLRRHGVRGVHELDWWQSARHGRWTLTCLPAQHWSNRISVPLNGSLWCSWLLESPDCRVYFGGDSGYFHGFAEIGRRYPEIDAALLPIGAYEPRWFMRYQHMNPAEAYRAFGDLGAKNLIPMHWGAFDLTFEPLDLPPEALAEAAAGDPRVRTLAVGETWPLGRVRDPGADILE